MASGHGLVPELPSDSDDWAYQVLLGCAMSRLLAFEPVDQNNNRASAASLDVAISLVDGWWKVVEGGDFALAQLEIVERTMVEFMGKDNPIASVLGVARQIFHTDNTRNAWFIATKEVEQRLLTVGDWLERRSTAAGATNASSPAVQPAPSGDEYVQVRSALPAILLHNAELDREVQASTQSNARSRLAELRSEARRSGYELQRLADQAAKLKFPGPDAPLDDVLGIIAQIQ